MNSEITNTRHDGGNITPFITIEDWSTSMREGYQSMDSVGEISKLDGLLNGLQAGLAALNDMPAVRNNIRHSRIRFNSTVEVNPFLPLDEIAVSNDNFTGNTALCAALTEAEAVYLSYLNELNATGQSATIGTMLLISDGAGNDGDATEQVASLVELHNNEDLFLMAAGVTDHDCDRLRDYGFPSVISLEHASWEGLFRFATASLTRLANGQSPGEFTEVSGKDLL